MTNPSAHPTEPLCGLSLLQLPDLCQVKPLKVMMMMMIVTIVLMMMIVIMMMTMMIMMMTMTMMMMMMMTIVMMMKCAKSSPGRQAVGCPGTP